MSTGRADETETWHLYVDESGRFQEDADRVVVGGVVVRGAAGSEHPHEEAMRAWLARACPLAPYPPHATVANRLSGLVLLAVRQPELAVRLGLEGVHAIVEKLDPRTRRRVEEWDPRRSGFSESLAQHVEAVMRRENRGALERIRSARHRWMRAATGAMAAMLRPGGGFPLGALESFVPGKARPAHEDRYLALLEVLLRRAALAVGSRGSPVVITLDVAERDVETSTDDARGEVKKLDLATLEVVAGRALAPLANVSVRFRARRVWSWGPDCPPGVVLADLVSNRLRAIAARVPPGWNDLVAAMRHDVGLEPVHETEPSSHLPTVSAAGVPDSAVAAVLRGEAWPELTRVQPSWAREQAELWLDYLRGAA